MYRGAMFVIQGGCTVLHHMETRKSGGERVEERQSREQDPSLRELQENCLKELKHLVLETSKQVVVHKIPILALFYNQSLHIQIL
jgi:hypothetical protein